MTAQLLENEKAVIAYIDMLATHHIAQREGVTEDGVVLVYRRGRRLTFYGHRSPQVLIQFLIKAWSEAITVITSRSQKQQFEELDIPKMVGYFRDKDDRGSRLFADHVAETFHPNIPSYIVYDTKLAKQMKLKTAGCIYLHKPYEWPPKILHIDSSMSPEDVISFVDRHRRPILREITLQDVHSTWSHNSRSQIVLAFVQPSTGQGQAFFRLLKRTAQRYGDDDDSYSFLWIDPSHFPSMLTYWTRTYHVDMQRPQIGLVNVSDDRSTWFDVGILEKQNEAQSLHYLQHWLNYSHQWQFQSRKDVEFQPTQRSSDHHIIQRHKERSPFVHQSISNGKDEL